MEGLGEVAVGAEEVFDTAGEGQAGDLGERDEASCRGVVGGSCTVS